MKLAAKAVLGTILGIAAILLVMKTPDWMRQHREAHAQQVIASLTPEQGISRCGRPFDDRVFNVFTPPVTRQIVYKKADSRSLSNGALILDFYRDGPGGDKWVFDEMAHAGMGLERIEAPTHQLALLPCLDSKQ